MPAEAIPIIGGVVSGIGSALLSDDSPPPNKQFQMQGSDISRRPMTPQQRKVFRQVGSLISGLLEMSVGGGNPLEQISHFRAQRRRLPSRFLSQPAGNSSVIIESMKQTLPYLQQAVAAKSAQFSPVIGASIGST